MRVVCESCRSAYGVDDALVTASGVRSQCPRCRHIQLARPVRASGVKVALSHGEAAALAAAQLDAAVAEAIRAPSGGPAAASAGPPPLPGAGRGAGPVASREQESPVAISDSPAPGAPATVTRFGQASAPDAPRPAQDEGAPRCPGCGKALDDPFDQALGSCDACRAAEKERSVLPSDLFDGNEPSNPGAPPEPLSDHFRGARPRVALPSSGVMTASREGAGRSGGWRVWAAAAGLLVLGGALFAFLRARRQASTSPEPVPPEVAQVVARFASAHAGSAPPAAELLARADERLRADRAEAYPQARALFEQRLAHPPLDPRAVAGFAEAVALGPSPDAAALADAKVLLDAVSSQGEGQGLIAAARADLALAEGGPGAEEKARALAQAALSSLSGKDVAWPQLTLGRLSLHSSGKLAVAAFDTALAADPAQRRGYVLRAAALASMGDYRGARADLQTRLALDPDHWPTLDALARIELDGGEVAQAARLLQRAKEARPSDPRPLLALAELHTGVEHRPERAVALLSTLEKRGSLTPEEAAAVQAHLAAAYRAQGRLTQAEKAVAKALSASAHHVPAHLQAVLIALDRGRPDDATAHLSALKGALEPGVPELLEGRVRFAQKDYAAAVAAFRAAVAADPRRHDALLWAGVASAAKGDRAAAEQAGLAAAQAAPFHLVPDVPEGPLTVPAEDLLEGAEGAYAKLAKGPGDVMPPLLEGVVRFHQGDLPGAQRSLDSVLAYDSGNVLARAYRAFIALARHDIRAAVRDAERAVASGRQFGLAHYARGVAQAAAGEAEVAKRELLQAKALAPSLLAADYQLALLDEERAPAAARDRLEGLLAIDPAFGPARRTLYRLEKE